jgi:HPt (histidine-containing phosphotransfer) domain-containing protein
MEMQEKFCGPEPVQAEPSDAESVTSRLDEFTADFGAEMAQEVIDTFVSDTESRLGAARAQLATRDYAGLGREAHALKGSAGSVGAPLMAKACEALEMLSKTTAAQDAGACVEDEAGALFVEVVKHFLQIKSAAEHWRAGG